MPGESKQNETTLGAANGVFSLEETLKSSFAAGSELSKKITENDLRDSYQRCDCNINESQKDLGFSSKCGKCRPSIESLVKKIQTKK